MDIGLIALDMDGTLLGPDYKVTPANAEAIRAAVAAGIHILICTGRTVEDIRFVMRNAGLFQYWLAGFNGALIVDGPDGQVVDKRFFSPELGKEIQEISRQYPLMLSAFLEDEVVYTAPAEMTLTRSEYVIQERTPIRFDPERMRRIHQEKVLKYVAFENDQHPSLAMAKAQYRTLPGVSVASSWEGNVELNAPGVDKSYAVRTVAERLGISRERVMAIGDQINDLPMLTWANVGVAMGNAVARVKEQCGYHTAVCEEDGVAKAIHRYALEGSI